MVKLYNIIIFLFLEIILCSPSCSEGKNNCKVCNPITNLCKKCQSNIFVPDENGGCQYSLKCILGNNYCLECDEKESLCNLCEKGYFPDLNGGCSYSPNCEISYKGECLQCLDDFILIGNEDDLKICKSLYSEDFINCKNISYNTGFCEECNEEYYLNSEDKKCTKTENCTKSTLGICEKCNPGYYLDKKQKKCILKDDYFNNCILTIDGKTCDKCEEGFYFDINNNCINTNFCELGRQNGVCKKCKSNYFLSKNDKSCTNDKNCFYGISDIGICEICNDGYYMDFTDGKCKSYEDDEEFKFCRKADGGVCYECISAYYLGEDNKCSSSKNCLEINNGICIQCAENYHLGLDNICSNVEHCIYSSPFFEECIECEDNFYYDNLEDICLEAVDQFKNCKIGNKDTFCRECKNDFYLNQKDNLCYSNDLKGKFYKCALSDSKGEYCIKCIENYFLSYKNNLCINTDGCNIAQDEEKCLECNEYHCLDEKTGKCEINQFIEDEGKKIYFRCNETNDEGTECQICKNEFLTIKDGLCVDNEHCLEENEKGICKICKNDESASYCSNEIFGCVKIYDENCLECNDILNLNKCTKCLEGYELNEDGDCEKIE